MKWATYQDIKDYGPINDVEEAKVESLVKAMLEEGWKGAPILYDEYGLITGSHRLEALKRIEKMLDVMDVNDPKFKTGSEILDKEIAIDVTEYVQKYCEAYEIGRDEIQYDSLGEIFQGTPIEQWKDELEW